MSSDSLVPPRGSLVQPFSAGVLASLVGFASTFAVVLSGFTAMGASPDEAASGLFAVCIGMGILGMGLSLWLRLPISIAWSTPGSALLIATGMPEGGFPVAVGAFLAAALLIVVAGLWRPFGKAVSSIPLPLAGAMLAGVLLKLCLAPLAAVSQMPALALPVIVTWALAWRFARLYAVPIAVAVTAVLVVATTSMPAGALGAALPRVVFVAPAFSLDAMIGIALPLFIVTMASQNVPGLAVLAVNGYRPDPGPIFVATGVGSALIAPLGGHSLNLAAITAALCAGPDAHPDPARRWLATTVGGGTYILFGLLASFAAAFIATVPPVLIEAVAGLALLGSLGSALSGALAREEDRIPAIATFLTTASGAAFFGIGSAFWGLIAGGLLMALSRAGRP